MPKKSNIVPPKTKQYYENLSFENLISAWMMRDGWEVFMPIVDHGDKTDLLVSDRNLYYRLQIKTLETDCDKTKVRPMWPADNNIDYVIYLSKSAKWGYITPPFRGERRLKHQEHLLFHQNYNSFIRAFERA